MEEDKPKFLHIKYHVTVVSVTPLDEENVVKNNALLTDRETKEAYVRSEVNKGFFRIASTELTVEE
jgi:hypothetical protein